MGVGYVAPGSIPSSFTSAVSVVPLVMKKKAIPAITKSTARTLMALVAAFTFFCSSYSSAVGIALPHFSQKRS